MCVTVVLVCFYVMTGTCIVIRNVFSMFLYCTVTLICEIRYFHLSRIHDLIAQTEWGQWATVLWANRNPAHYWNVDQLMTELMMVSFHFSFINHISADRRGLTGWHATVYPSAANESRYRRMLQLLTGRLCVSVLCSYRNNADMNLPSKQHANVYSTLYMQKELLLEILLSSESDLQVPQPDKGFENDLLTGAATDAAA